MPINFIMSSKKKIPKKKRFKFSKIFVSVYGRLYLSRDKTVVFATMIIVIPVTK